jgi:protein-disulfide isomerase
MARLLTALAALFALIMTPASAQSFNAQEQAEMRAIVREYLINNPDVLREALEALSERTAAERWRRIKSDPRDFTMGPADAPIVIVEFFDYRCGYCHAALEWVTDVARTRRDVRIVLKEFPVLSPESVEASHAALAAMPQGRYWQFHQALMAFRGDLTTARINQLASQSGIDVARMRRAMAERGVEQLILDNRALALDLEENPATPIFLINGELVRGFRPDELDQRLREATTAARARRTASR